ncbi:hypothetical protein IV203_025055 [Nitzschia inconspicua]|uniref:DUF4215 domain-containing protein n=1 Tax=Nitzschia inconspicua TaxID=303405 RepID=A0A9K3K6L2_9STRA|nr:hypothetical protein IV203_036999 [Nitzschia inconspicua]KAG7339604.1 hypothetical protein IV203_025197 [Nitzschia inconspicua]KAG7365614.1 hypothetical protein IV203_025055 [Nitzschia inconspicua]
MVGRNSFQHVIKRQFYAIRIELCSHQGNGVYKYGYRFKDCRSNPSPRLSHWQVIVGDGCTAVQSVSCTFDTGATSTRSFSLRNGDPCLAVDQANDGWMVVNDQNIAKCDRPDSGEVGNTGTLTLFTCEYPASVIGPSCSEAVCGDNVIEGGETCEFFDGVPTVETCHRVIQRTSGETCDGGENCRSDCTYCGDGIVQSGEQCDGGDGCNDDCTVNTCPCTESDLPVFVTTGDGFADGTVVVVECDHPLDSVATVTATSCASDVDATPLAVTGGEITQPTAFCDSPTVTRTWTAENCASVQGSVTQTVQYVDTKPPSFVSKPMMGNITSSCESSENYAPSSDWTASDTCDPSVTVSHCDACSDATVGGMTITRRWTATDCASNSITESETIVVTDFCDATIRDSYSGIAVDVRIQMENVEGGLEVTVTVVDDVYTGDIRGIFLELIDADAVGRVTSVVATGSAPVTSYKAELNNIDRLSNDVTMKGGGPDRAILHDLGIEIGKMGIAKGDDYQTASFIIGGISTDDIVGKVGIRLTSVGVSGSSRDQSSKISDVMTCCCRATCLSTSARACPVQ